MNCADDKNRMQPLRFLWNPLPVETDGGEPRPAPWVFSVRAFTQPGSGPTVLLQLFAAHAAYPKAVTDMKRDKQLWRSSKLRQIKYLNNIVEQDQGRIKQLVGPGLGFERLQEGRTGVEAVLTVRALFDHPIPGLIPTRETYPKLLRTGMKKFRNGRETQKDAGAKHLHRDH